MYSYSIVDAHAHIFPEKIAQKATENIGRFYDIPMCHLGSAEELLRRGSEFFLCVGGIRSAHIAVQLDRCYSVSENPKHTSMLCVIPKMLGVISSVSIKHGLELRL